MTPAEAFEHFLTIIKTLRGPDGCPWDREQTPSTLKEHLIEESYECIEAIIDDDTPHIKEELGDLYLLVTMLSFMYEQEKKFTISDVFSSIRDKLIRRHPHVFADSAVDNPDDVIKQWDAIKQDVEKQGLEKKYLETIPTTYPPLERALKIQKKVKKIGFDWDEIDSVWEKYNEEIDEFKTAVDSGDRDKAEEEFGDILFTLINIARFLHIDPSTALHLTNRKFERRFHYIEKMMRERNMPMNKDNFKTMDELWEEAKDVFKS